MCRDYVLIQLTNTTDTHIIYNEWTVQSTSKFDIVIWIKIEWLILDDIQSKKVNHIIVKN